MQKIIWIFLDVDGVLNSESAFIYNHQLWEKDKNVNITAVIDEQKLIIFNDFCQKLKEQEITPRIILSSTWRKSPYLKEVLSNRLKKYGLILYGETPCLSKERGYEIQEFCQMHNIHKNSIIIFDDDSDMQDYSDRLVKTYFRDGLTYKDVECALLTTPRT